MAICTKCGGRRIPVEGLRLHPNCYPADAELWPAADRAAYLAVRSTPDTTGMPPTSRMGATKGASR